MRKQIKVRACVAGLLSHRHGPAATARTLQLAFILFACLHAAVAATFTKFTTAPVGTDIGNGHGSAWIDYDQDGHLDLYDVNYNVGNPVPPFLYRNLGDGTFQKITNTAITQFISASPTCVWGDFDNDGFPDLFLPDQNATNRLFRNNGDGTFEQVLTGPIATEAGARTFHAAWADYNNDGLLDLFAAGSLGGRNMLYRNLGDGQFESVTNCLPCADITFSTGCVWTDYNNDGWADLFVVHGRGADMEQPNRLYQNNHDGTFTRITNAPISTDRGNGLGAAWGDYDNDGDVDLFVPNERGGLVSFLYRNEGGSAFARITNGPAVTNVAESMAASWADYDNDGWLDLFVANGRGGSGAKNFLYRNNADGTFTQITSGSIVNDLGLWHGAVWGDYNQDGFLDLFASNWVGFGSPVRPNALYRNDGNSNRWLVVRCVGRISTRDAMGARVRVKTSVNGTNLWQLRHVGMGTAVVQNTPQVHFGLGEATNVDLLQIEWPSGTVQEFANVSPSQHLTIIEPPRLFMTGLAGGVRLFGGRGTVYTLQASTNLLDWFDVKTATNATGTLQIDDIDATNSPVRFYRALEP